MVANKVKNASTIRECAWCPDQASHFVWVSEVTARMACATHAADYQLRCRIDHDSAA